MPSSRPESIVIYLLHWLLLGLLLGGLGGLQLVIGSGNIAAGLLLLAFGVVLGAVGAPLKYAWDRRRGFPSPERHVAPLASVFGLLAAAAAAASGFVGAFDCLILISLQLLGAALVLVVMAVRRGRRTRG